MIDSLAGRGRETKRGTRGWTGPLLGSTGLLVLITGLSPVVTLGVPLELDRGSPSVGLSVGPWVGVTSLPSATSDTVALPAEWPDTFPALPAGGSVAGVTRVDPERLRGARAGPYFIVALNLPASEDEAFVYYREALRAAEWALLEGLTNDGSRPGLVTIGFEGHGYGGDIRFQEVLGSVLATIHLYRDDPDP